MIPETSHELHLNLSDQSRLRSSWSLTCLTALNSLCVHKACMCRDSCYSGAHLPLALSLPERPRSAAAHTHAGFATPSHSKLQKNISFSSVLVFTAFLFFIFFTNESCVRSVCRWWNLSSSSLDELFLAHMAAILIPGCLRIFRDSTLTDLSLVCAATETESLCVVSAFYDEVDTFGSNRARQKVVPPC